MSTANICTRANGGAATVRRPSSRRLAPRARGAVATACCCRGVAALVLGMGIGGGAFVRASAAEVAQLDISASFAIAILALIAVLPEYAIESILAWKAGASFDVVTREITPRMQLVAANVTGSNRLLIGLGWSLVILIFWLKRRRALDLRGYMALEMTMLIAATAASFLIVFMGHVHNLLAGVLSAS